MRLKAIAAPVLTVATVAFFILGVHGQTPDVPTGQWLAGPVLAQSRAGAVGVTLDDGRVLVIGGRTADGPVHTVEVFDKNGALSVGAPLLAPRAGHAAAKLPDGRVLVVGGTTLVTTQTENGPVTSEGATASAEVFDPVANTWSPAASLSIARSGHTATAVADGYVLVAGGAGQDGAALDSFEVFDAASGAFSLPGLLSAGRTEHAAAAASAATVLVAGGRNAAGVLGTADIVELANGTVTSVVLNAPRAGTSATALLDGRILLAGGSDGASELASAEIVDPVTALSAPTGSMSQPRRGHEALLLDNNNTVLITGGTSGNAVVAPAEQFIPWSGEFSATGSPAVSRTSAVLSNLPTDGASWLAGGHVVEGGVVDSTDLYGFATLKTDKDDYAPGTTVVITGSGWQPGETVTLVLHEVGTGHADRTYQANADGAGRITSTEFVPDVTHMGVRFYLTARGAAAQAQTTFTDAAGDDTDVFVSCASVNLTLNTPVTCTAQVNNVEPTPNNGWPQGTAAFQVTQGTGNFSPATCTLVQLGLSANSSCSVSFTPTSTGPAKIKANYNNANNNWKNGTSEQLPLTVTAPTDTTPPSITPTVTGTLGSSGWYVSSVTISWTVADPDSTVTSTTGCGTTTISVDTPGTTLTCSATSAGGTSSQSVTIKRDATAPAITLAGALPAANVNGWRNADVTVTWNCADAMSGAATATAQQVVSSEGAGLSVTGTCTDNAGNSSSDTQAGINIDKTAPTASVAASPAANANEWNNTDVTVSFSGNDSLSGVDFCSAGVVLSSEGAGQSANGSCTDEAGNVSAVATVTGINIDKTAPTASASASPAANAYGWNNTNVTVTFSGTDSLSGLDGCAVVQVLSAEGAGQSASGTCTDKAGNVSVPAIASGIKIDKTVPTTTFDTRSPAANGNGWNNADVTVSWTCGDGLSGVLSSSVQQVVTGEGQGLSATGACEDKAGNTSSDTQLDINIDKTAPNVSATPSPAANAYGWNNMNVTVTFGGTDTLSGIGSCSPVEVLSAEGAGQSATGTCTDKAGNVADATATAINIDKTAPTASASPSPAPNANGWNNTNVTVTFSGTDGLSGVDSCAAAQVLSAEGTGQSASGTCMDKAGNVSAPAVASGIDIDKTAPILAPSISPSPVLLNGSATASANAGDTLSGVASQSCGAVDASSVGPKSLTCTATDNAGNISNATVNYTVQYATGGNCLGSPSRFILQPVNADGTSVFKKGSTVPAKFRVCDADGASIGTAGVVVDFRLVQRVNGTIVDVDEAVISTTPDTVFRWSPVDRQWIFNMNTKALTANVTYVYDITLDDGSLPIRFQFGLK